MWDYVGVGPNSTKFNAKVKQYTDFFDEFIDSSEIASKLENYNDDSKFELNFMERLIVALRQGKLSREELHHECLTFISAGHETSSHTLTFLIWDLCVHPELQEELYETVKNINDLNSLPPLDLLDRVLRESQRLHSIVTGSTSRLAAEDTIICGFQIPKGTNFQLSYRAVHLNPTYYPSPLKFNPDRWLDPKTMKQPFFPFGGGEHAW